MPTTTRFLLSRAKGKNRKLEILLAIVVPSSAVAGLPLWSNAYLAVVWAAIVGIAALVSVAKPFMHLTDAVESYEAAVARYRTVETDLSEIRTEVSQAQAYNSETKAMYLLASRSLYRAREVEPKDPLDEELREGIYNRIALELPGDSFYVPER